MGVPDVLLISFYLVQQRASRFVGSVFKSRYVIKNMGKYYELLQNKGWACLGRMDIIHVLKGIEFTASETINLG